MFWQRVNTKSIKTTFSNSGKHCKGNEYICWRVIEVGQRSRKGSFLIGVVRKASLKIGHGLNPKRGEAASLVKSALDRKKKNSVIYYALHNVSNFLLHYFQETAALQEFGIFYRGQIVCCVSFQLKSG